MNRRSALPSIVALLHCQKRRSPTSETLSLGGQAGANFHPHDANLSPCLFGSSRRPSRLGLGRGWRCEAGCSRAPPAAAHSQWSTASPRPWQPPPARLSSGIGVPVPAARPKRAGPPLRRLVATVTLLWTLALPLLCLRSCTPPAPPPAPPPRGRNAPTASPPHPPPFCHPSDSAEPPKCITPSFHPRHRFRGRHSQMLHFQHPSRRPPYPHSQDWRRRRRRHL